MMKKIILEQLPSSFEEMEKITGHPNVRYLVKLVVDNEVYIASKVGIVSVWKHTTINGYIPTDTDGWKLKPVRCYLGEYHEITGQMTNCSSVYWYVYRLKEIRGWLSNGRPIISVRGEDLPTAEE